MEDTLREVASCCEIICYTCLNPCFNGRYSQSPTILPFPNKIICLNPCFNGRYSQSMVVCYDIINYKIVLILVLMEDTLRVTTFNNYRFENLSLNPCFNGRYSQRKIFYKVHLICVVLILVLMEDTLRDDSYCCL